MRCSVEGRTDAGGATKFLDQSGIDRVEKAIMPSTTSFMLLLYAIDVPYRTARIQPTCEVRSLGPVNVASVEKPALSRRVRAITDGEFGAIDARPLSTLARRVVP